MSETAYGYDGNGYVVHQLNRDDFGAVIVRAEGAGSSTHTLGWTDYVTGEWHESYASEEIARHRLDVLIQVCDAGDGFSDDIEGFTRRFGEITGYVVEVGTYGEDVYPSTETVNTWTLHETLAEAMSDAEWHAEHYGLQSVPSELRWGGYDQDMELSQFVRVVPQVRTDLIAHPPRDGAKATGRKALGLARD